MGMFFRINVDSSDSVLKCADWIIKNREYKETLDIEKISALNTSNWVYKIDSIYETALSSSECEVGVGDMCAGDTDAMNVNRLDCSCWRMVGGGGGREKIK